MSGPLPPRSTPPGSDDPSPDDTLRRQWEEGVLGAEGAQAGGAAGWGGEACPAPEALLDAIEAGHLHPEPPLEDDRARILNHLARCARCRDEARIVGALLGAAQEEASAGGGPASGSAVEGGPGRGIGKGSGAPGRQGPGSPGGTSPSRWNPFPLAAAATLLLVVGGGGVLWWSGGAGDGVVRGEGEAAFTPTLACPEAGLVEVSWPVVEGARGYRVELFDGEGAVLAEGEVVPSHLQEEGAGATSAPALALTLRFDASRAREAPAEVRLIVEARLPGGGARAASPLPLPDPCFGTDGV